VLLSSGFVPGETLPHDLRSGQFQTVEITHVLAVVVARPVRLSIEQVERFDAYVGSADATLQERPKLFESIGVDVTVDIRDGVINNLMRVVSRQSFVREQRVGIQRSTSLNVFSDLRLKRFLLAVRNDDGSHFAATFYDGRLESCPCRRCR
jgi:hypothetical protein